MHRNWVWHCATSEAQLICPHTIQSSDRVERFGASFSESSVTEYDQDNGGDANRIVHCIGVFVSVKAQLAE
jgi:hypothetical protein